MRKLTFALLILLVFVRYFSTLPDYQDGQRLRIKGVVLSEPVSFGDRQRIVIAGLKIYLPLYPTIKYGDKIIIEGRVEDGFLKDPMLLNHEVSKNLLYKLRDRVISFYKRNLPEPDASLVAGITLGAKADIPEEFYEKLKNTGTLHVVVASGTNVTFVAIFMINILINFIKRRRAILLSIISIWIYTAISGFDAPLVRAAIMGSLAFTAQALGKQSTALNSLFISALIMLLVIPSWFSDVGFILSFVATLSLILFERKINSKICFVPRIFREGLSTSLAAQIGVSPVLIYFFGGISLIGPFINALILWTVPFIMVVGLASGLMSLIWELPAKYLLLLSYPFTRYFEILVSI